MFTGGTKILAEGLGAANNCNVYFRSSILDKSDYQSFLLPDETSQILLKCTKGEYIFTDCSFTMIFGNAAVGTKRTINRYDYREFPLKEVVFETAGLNDYDCQLRLLIGNNSISIDIKKAEQDDGIKVYRILQQIAIVQEGESRNRSLAVNAFNGAMSHAMISDAKILGNIVNIAIEGAETLTNRYNRRSYRDIFDSFLNNN